MGLAAISRAKDKSSHDTRKTPIVQLVFLMVPGTGIEPVRLFRYSGMSSPLRPQYIIDNT
jgi:hypothetical protein